MNIEQRAKELAGNWRNFNNFSWHDQPENAEDYAIVYTHNRDSGLLEKSNAKAIALALEPFLGPFDDVRAEHHNHWAFGWFDGYAIRVCNSGQITDAFKAYYELQERLADYPFLDETDYFRSEREATLLNIEFEGQGIGSHKLPKNWVEETYCWLCENNDSAIENVDDEGGYPTREQIQAAWDNLGYKR